MAFYRKIVHNKSMVPQCMLIKEGMDDSMRNLRKWAGLLFLILPLYKYIQDWREEEKRRERKNITS